MSARIRQVFFFDKVEELDVSWNNVVQYRIVYIRGYSMGFRSGNFRGYLLDWLVKFALIGCRYDLGFQLGNDLLDNVSRLNNLIVYSRLEISDCLVEDSPKLCKATDVVSVVL